MKSLLNPIPLRVHSWFFESNLQGQTGVGEFVGVNVTFSKSNSESRTSAIRRVGTVGSRRPEVDRSGTGAQLERCASKAAYFSAARERLRLQYQVRSTFQI